VEDHLTPHLQGRGGWVREERGGQGKEGRGGQGKEGRRGRRRREDRKGYEGLAPPRENPVRPCSAPINHSNYSCLISHLCSLLIWALGLFTNVVQFIDSVVVYRDQ